MSPTSISSGSTISDRYGLAPAEPHLNPSLISPLVRKGFRVLLQHGIPNGVMVTVLVKIVFAAVSKKAGKCAWMSFESTASCTFCLGGRN